MQLFREVQSRFKVGRRNSESLTVRSPPKSFHWLIVISLWAALLLFTEANTAETSAKSKITATREQFNQAIVDRDAIAIGQFLAPSYHIVTGRSAQSHGRATEIGTWSKLFEDDPKFGCHRTPLEITVNESWGLAQETGEWKCHYQVKGTPADASGVYSSKWQRAMSSRWLLQSEVFTTLRCEGADSACRPPDPITD